MTNAPAIRDLETRRLGLRRSKRRATGLLVLAVTPPGLLKTIAAVGLVYVWKRRGLEWD